VVVLYNMKGASQTPLDSGRTEGGSEAEQSGGRLMIGDGGGEITFIYHFHWIPNHLMIFSLPFHFGVICFRFHKALGAASVSSSCELFCTLPILFHFSILGRKRNGKESSSGLLFLGARSRLKIVCKLQRFPVEGEILNLCLDKFSFFPFLLASR